MKNKNNNDPKQIVRDGYDACAEKYLESRKDGNCDDLKSLTSRLKPGAKILDIGCGPGIPIARMLSKGHNVTGVDISEEQIKLARANVPQAEFIVGDIMSVDFAKDSFDAVICYYSIFHLPREEHAELFAKIAKWLKPGGYLLATLSNDSEESYVEDDFFDTTMHRSNFSLGQYLKIISAVGLRLVEQTMTGHGFGGASDLPEESHPLVLFQSEL